MIFDCMPQYIAGDSKGSGNIASEEASLKKKSN